MLLLRLVFSSDVTFTAAQFTGEGFLQFTDATQYNLSHTYISFELATVQRDGLILWNGQVIKVEQLHLSTVMLNHFSEKSKFCSSNKSVRNIFV